jgi:hypothetical protein
MNENESIVMQNPGRDRAGGCTFRAIRLRKKRICSERGRTRGPRVVMLAFKA